MTPDRWKQVSRLFESALERETAERARYLDEACGADAGLRREVEALISAHEGAEGGSFMRSAAVEQVADTLIAVGEESPCEGETFGHFCIVRPVGVGGMGEVFLAEDTKPEHKRRRVALKLLAPRFMRDAERLRRFEQEAQAALALNHPNVMTIYEIGEERGRRFIATEYIEGRTLRQIMSERRLKLSEALDVAAQIAAALIAAHEAGVVHRDVKPENVMIRRDHIVKVLDFGLAKLTETRAAGGGDGEAQRTLIRTGPGTVLGTVSYMSPEQSRGLQVDARTDVWSLGCVLYEMVAGRLPFEGEDIYLQAQAIREQDPQPLALYAEAVPDRLEEIVRKALAKDPEERYQTVRDLALDLQYLKRKLEVDAEVERALASSKRATTGPAPGVETRGERARVTGAFAEPRTEADDVSRRPTIAAAKGRRSRIVYALASAALLVAGAWAVWYFVVKGRAPVLTERDTIMLADFVNTTGDAVFDGTLKQALAVQLGQSPFLNIFSDERVRETLKFMGLSPDERVTREVARQICRRQGLKALLAGTITKLGSRYVVTLEAVAAETGDRIASEQAEADTREAVLRALGDAATRMRRRLGESLQSIRKFDAPIEQATTSSLEALNAYSLGREKTARGSYLEAIPFYKRAVELDPNFASAYWALGVAYANSRQQEPAAEAARKAFELRDRASERERLHITANYYLTTGEADKHLEALEVLVRTYPRDSIARNNLGNRYVLMGQHEQAAAELREAITLNPNNSVAYTNLGIAFLHLNRFDEAKAVSEEALAAGLDSSGIRANLFFVAFVTGDAEGQARQLEWFRGKPDEYIAQNFQSLAALFGGRVREYEEFNRQCVTTLQTRSLTELAASAAAHRPLMRALVGDCRGVREETAAALALVRSRDALRNGALAAALCGDAAQSQQLADERARLNPQDTLLNTVWLPTIRAASEVERGDPASAVATLEPARQYEAGTLFNLWPAYVRGLAHLRSRDGASAAAEFRKIVEHRGLVPVSVIYPLAHLGLARAYALSGDAARARTTYQDFFALWRDADPDTPALTRAREEYDRLKQ